MIKTPVHAATELDNEDEITYTGEIYDDSGNSICIAELDFVDDIIKRINLHDKLVEALKSSTYALKQQYGNNSDFVNKVDELLEKCK